MSIVKFGNSDKDSNGNNIVRRFGKKADRVTYWKWGEPLSFYILDAVKNYLPKYVIQNEFCQALLKSISIQLVRLESEIQQLSNYIFRPKPAVQYANSDLQLYINFGEKTDIVRKAIKDFYLIHKQRGTTLGIINDLRRVTGDNSAYIIYSGYNDCGWWLDYTYPEYNAAGKIAINSNVYYDLQNMLDIVFCNHSGRPTEELIKIIRNEIVPINIETRFIEMQPHVVAWGEPYNFIDPDILQFGVFLFGEIKGGCGFNYNVPPAAETVNYAKLQNTTLSFTFTDNTVVGDPITDPSELTAAIDNFVVPNHRVLATTGAGTTGSVSSGLIYWINCENASSVEINSDTITINFTNGDPLEIVYENSTEAGLEKEHIDFCFHNANLDRFMQGKTVHKVSPYFVTNVALRQYTTYTEARAEAIAGDVIYFENCDYITGTERFVLKDQVDIIFKNTYVEITEAAFWRPVFPSIKPTYAHKPLFCDEAGVVTVYVLGNVNVRHAANTSGWAVVDMKNDNSKIFIAFNKLWADPIPANIISFFHLNADTRIWAKGFSTIGGRVYDDDQYPALQLNNIDYIDYYKLEDDKITVVNVIADIIEIEVPNYFTAKYTSDQFFATNYKRLVTVPDENGIPYIINITEVVSTDKSANILSIAFATHTLDITCLNDDHAERNKTYVDKVKYGYNILNTFTGTRKYLNLNGLEDYSTLTQALANIGTNELLIIRAGTYTDYIVPIPNGTNIYCENGVIINAEFRNETFHSYNIYGHANFDSVTGTSFFVQAQGEVRPLSYIECKDIRGGVRTTLNFNGIMKCRNVTNYGANCTLFDTDGATYLDCDAVNITISGADVVFIAYINQSRHATLRNAKITNTGVATYYVNEAYAEYEYNLINCRVKNIGLDIQFGVISCFSNGEIQTFNIFRSIMETNSPNVFYNDDINFNQINLIGVSYSNKVGSGQSNYDSNKLEVNAATSINDIYNLSTATTDPISVDLDILYLTTTDVSQNLLFFPFSKECNWRLRNFYAIGGYTSDYNIGGSFRFVNCKFSNAQFPTTYEGIEYFKIWRCIFDYDSYIAIGDVTPSLENFNQSFAKGNGLPDGTETLPNIVEQSTIVVTPPEL